MPKFMIKWIVYVVLAVIGTNVTTLPGGVVDAIVAFFMMLF
jgi:hypothetical protein